MRSPFPYRRTSILERVVAHIIFWIVILILSSPLWLPEGCTRTLFGEAGEVRQVKIGGALVIAEVTE